MDETLCLNRSLAITDLCYLLPEVLNIIVQEELVGMRPEP